jgi:hypothetical protein
MFKLLCNAGFRYLCGAIIYMYNFLAVICTLFYIVESSVQLKNYI